MNANKDFKEALASLGLPANAVAFYLQSFRHGKATIGKIAAACQMDRSSAYAAYRQLQAAGLLEEREEASGKVVWAKPPKTVLGKLRTDIRRLRQQYEDLEVALPELLAEYSPASAKPVLQYFSGHDGLNQISEDVLDHAQGEILLLSNQRLEKRVFNEVDHREFIRDRLQRGIRIRVLAPDTPEARELQKQDRRWLRETRLIPPPEPFENETYVYGDRVAMLSFHDEALGFIVRSVDFAKAQRWMFEQLWIRYAPR